jgi:cytosine/uracil/thiamine/allantoin permease
MVAKAVGAVMIGLVLSGIGALCLAIARDMKRRWYHGAMYFGAVLSVIFLVALCTKQAGYGEYGDYPERPLYRGMD